METAQGLGLRAEARGLSEGPCLLASSALCPLPRLGTEGGALSLQAAQGLIKEREARGRCSCLASPLALSPGLFSGPSLLSNGSKGGQ